MTQNPSTCPQCGNDHLYQLGDGRYKCSACQKRFSHSGRRSRLSSEAMAAIVSGFVSGNPASAVAMDADLNLKTVQLYYGRIRELLANDRENDLARFYGSARVSSDLFSSSDQRQRWKNAILIGCLVDQESEIDLLLASDAEEAASSRLESSSVDGWLVAADRKALDDLQIDRILCLPGKGAKQRVRNFWLNAKRRLSAYCGGFRKHFRLYLREMEFRNNIENPAAARDYIEMLLKRNSTKPTGEEDA